MDNISVNRNVKQVLRADSVIKHIVNLSSCDFTITITTTGAIFLRNAYLYHANFRTVGVTQAVRNFTSDTYPMTTPAVEFALDEPYTWLRASVPHFWEQGQMAMQKITFICKITNGSGADIDTILRCYALVELTAASQLAMTIDV